jgi:hypothetical protein
MAIRIAQNVIQSFTGGNELGAGSVAGGIAYPFQIPQDTDNVTVKFTSSVVGAYSAVFQTSDDGGTTYYDVARTSIVSNANNTTAEWLSIPTLGAGMGLSATAAAGSSSVVGATTGSAAASTLGSRQYNGLPILGIQNRIFVRITGNVTSAASNAYNAQVRVNNQSATA